MNCPACRSDLLERYVTDIRLEVCEEGCAGVWIDGSELAKLDQDVEPDAETILNLGPNKDVTYSKLPHNCPKCRTNELTIVSPTKPSKKKLLIEECSKCRGVFMDANVLNEIRRENSTETLRKLAAAKLYEDSFGKSKNDRLKLISQAVKFLCPSFYLQIERDREAL